MPYEQELLWPYAVKGAYQAIYSPVYLVPVTLNIPELGGFNGLVSVGDAAFAHFSGLGGFGQHGTMTTPDGSTKNLCGDETYLMLRDDWNGPETTDPDGDKTSGYIRKTYDYVFHTGEDPSYDLELVENVTAGDPLSFIYGIHTDYPSESTARHFVFLDRDSEGHVNVVHGAASYDPEHQVLPVGQKILSEPINVTWLKEKLELWYAQDQPFKMATGGSGNAYQSQTNSGAYAKVIGGSVWGQADLLPTSDPEDGVIGWSGGFQLGIRLVARRNAPVVRSDHGPSASGNDIYRFGSSSVILEEPITSRRYKDYAGTYDPDGAEAFSQIGWGENVGYATKRVETGRDALHQLISADGKTWRVTLRIQRSEEGESIVEEYRQYVVASGSPVEFTIVSNDDYIRQAYVDKVELQVGAEWQDLTSTRYVLSDPGPFAAVLWLTKWRVGARWGHPPLSSGGEYDDVRFKIKRLSKFAEAKSVPET
jgi:hypothetical protein